MPLEAFAHQMRDRIRKETGLTVGVGIGPTKTLALYSDQQFLNDIGTVASQTYASSICS